ncbi:AAA family ATPase [Pyrococcus kukulkanii]|uniref:AAA family ATPase n=2 Tax=Pyrococcus kukulkanii TaxID=1609559 RepID=UPI003565F87E
MRSRRGISFFDQRPRKNKESLFGRSEELEMLINALHARSWVAILGPRMVGKTSLAWAGANTFAREMKYKVIFVDLRNAETSRQATEKILSRLPKSIFDTISKYIAEVSFSTGSVGASVKLRENVTARNALEDALFALKDTILILDEVQNVKQGVKNFLQALAAAFNENDSLLVIFTGSYAGVVKKLFEATYREGLYGRPPVEILLPPWPEWVAAEFLRRGFEHCGVSVTQREIQEAIWRLGTSPGWLNLYGLRRCLGATHAEALQRVFKKAVNEALKELEHFLEGRSPKAREVVKRLAYGATWSELEKTGISKDTLSRLLEVLTKELFIVVKDEIGVYRFSDPIYRYAAEKLQLNEG